MIFCIAFDVFLIIAGGFLSMCTDFCCDANTKRMQFVGSCLFVTGIMLLVFEAMRWFIGRYDLWLR
jgi:hypothetical protein